MHDFERDVRDWARGEFGSAQLGDRRRISRLVRVGTLAAMHPDGRISEVFRSDADRQGAYDLIENPSVRAEHIAESVFAATARRCVGNTCVLVALDGTSIKLWDGKNTKDFGAIGTYANGARGLKLINGLAIDTDGTPIGLCTQVWWKRPVDREPPIRWKFRRKLEETETVHWRTAVHSVADYFAAHAPDTRCWFQIDRGGDARRLLKELNASSHWFTVRAQTNRRIRGQSRRRDYLWQRLEREPALGSFTIDVPPKPGRRGRRARISVRSAKVTLVLRDRWLHKYEELTVNAVYVKEDGRTARGCTPLDWVLLTNHPVANFKNAKKVAESYTRRWRIEEFHKTWKTGACNVERSQLRKTAHVIKWATILSVVAARIERLKYLARNEPNLPATDEFQAHELRALVLLKRQTKKANEVVPDTTPTIHQAVTWIAELGGYTGKSSGGPPGTITIARGMERLQPAAELMRALIESGQLR